MNKERIFDTEEILFKEAADLIVSISKKSISKKNRFCIALSGGNSPRKLYELLAQDPYANSIEWQKTFVFWGDERCVPSSDEQNNSNMAFKALLTKIRIPKENIFPVPVELSPAAAAVSYEKQLVDFFNTDLPSFDLILLGLGDNGHTASLFPFTTILSEKEHIVKEVFVKELNTYRISFTIPLINNADHILFLVTGKEKAGIIKTIFSDNYEPEKYPVQLIKPLRTDPGWFLDKAAASQLNLKN